MENIGYYNGRIAPLEALTMPVLDRSVYFGDGVYDATFCLDGILLGIDAHIERFFVSCESVGIIPPLSHDKMILLLASLCERLECKSMFVYWQVSRATGIRQHVLDGTPNLLIMIYEKEMTPFDKRLVLISREDKRHSLCNIKTLNLLYNVQAARDADECGADEVIFIHDSVITECSHSNISIIKNGSVITPPLSNRILAGITRQKLLECCRKLGVLFFCREIPYDELLEADEVVITSAGSLAIAASIVDGHKVGGRAPILLEMLRDELLLSLRQSI